MSLIDFLKTRLFTDARKKRFAYIRSIGPKRRVILIAAAFVLCLQIGLQSSLLGSGQPHLINGIVWALLSGLEGAAYVTVIGWKPKFVLLLMLGQAVANLTCAHVLAQIDKSQPKENLQQVVSEESALALISTAAAYTLIFTFISVEGRFAFRAQTELALAHAIQKTLAPVVAVVEGGFEFYGISAPSEKVGGDLLDVVKLTDGSMVAYIADVAGHGLQAGILMGMIKTAARTKLLDASGLPDLFDRLNRVLPGVKEQNMYATSAALLLKHAPDQEFDIEYAVAGHPPILQFSNRGKLLAALGDEQFPLGLFPRVDYRSHRAAASRGDLLILTTDGVLEASNKFDQEFGKAELERIVAAHVTEPLSAIADHILAAVRKWGRQEDDQTLLLIRLGSGDHS